jgi:hypothetical protein
MHINEEERGAVHHAREATRLVLLHMPSMNRRQSTSSLALRSVGLLPPRQ